MASENTARGQMQIAIVVGGVMLAMLAAAGGFYAAAGAHGLHVPGSSSHHSGH